MLNQNGSNHNRDKIFIDNSINNNDTNFDDIRTNGTKHNKLESSENFYNRDDNINLDEANNLNTTKNIKSSIYRYKFDDTIINEIHNFAKIHEFDGRKDFKEAWNNWITEKNTIISQETQRLLELGYEGDVIDKMFKSARYYFRKKRTEKKEPSRRRNYIGLQKELLESMDNHILNNIKKDDYKPAKGFDNFCKENLDLLKIEVNKLISYNITNINEIKNKIKKTYKNRYFMIINK